eukprot:21388_1
MITKYGCCAVHGIVNDAVSKRLYQKVAKELLSRLKSGKHKFGAINKGNIDWNCAVFLMDLASTMQQKMNEDQDKVQMCAESYILVAADVAVHSLIIRIRT